MRSGTIAAVPEELIFDAKTGAEYHAYLVEARSLGGLSGSPAFVSIPPQRAKGLNANHPNDGYSALIGVIRGHWDLTVPDSIDGFDDQGKIINMGMAAVTPIQELAKLLMTNETFLRERENLDCGVSDGTIAVDHSARLINRYAAQSTGE